MRKVCPLKSGGRKACANNRIARTVRTAAAQPYQRRYFTDLISAQILLILKSSMTRRDILLGALGAGTLLRGATATAATVTVTSKVLVAVGPGFAGLSYEKGQMANSFFSPQNANAIGLFKLIGPSLLRIGGNSVDKTTWTPSGKGRTSGQVAPSDIDALAGFLKATGWQVLYGTNLAQSTPARAAAEIAYAGQSLGSSLYGIEIGNE